MTLFFKKRFFSGRQDQALGCALIDKIAAGAQSSADLNTALRSAVDEIGRTLDLERAAILLSDESGMARIGEYSANGVGPVEREKLRQVDLEIARDHPSLVSVL